MQPEKNRTTMQQGALHLIWPERYGADEFIVADCNRLAVQLIQNLDQWKTGTLILTGPAFSGKTHLAHIFAEKYDGMLITEASQLSNAIESEIKFVVIDSADKLLTENPDQSETFFHLVNAAFLGQLKLLLTVRDTPATWVKLPDLLSRLQACQQVELKQPDEEMIKGAYQKLFVDRGLMVDNKVLDYLSMRSERSFSGIKKNVEILDTLSLETARKITIPLIQNTELF